MEAVKETMKKSLSVAVGVIIGVAIIWLGVVLVRDHKTLKQVTAFLNAQIQLAQQQSQQVQQLPVTDQASDSE